MADGAEVTRKAGWETDGYDPSEVYTRATDGQGHKEVMHIPLPPYLLNQIGSFVSDAKVLGYRTPQDFVRDAIVHRLHHWGDSLPPDRKIAWKTTMAMVRTEKRIWEMEQVDALVARMREGMEKAVRAEQLPALADSIEECEEHARDMIEAGQEGVGVFEALATEMRLELGRIKARRTRA